MSTPARYARTVVQTEGAASAMAISTALVPIDRGPPLAPPDTEKPSNAHRLFYGLGYTGLALIWAAMWLHGFSGERFAGVGILGVMFVGLGGFGITIHTLWKPNERKVRHLLLAIGSLALTLALISTVERISREMYATAAVVRLQPLAEALANDTRIRNMGASGDRVSLNGYHGRAQGSGQVEGLAGEHALADVLARDGISGEEYRAYRRWLERVGMNAARRTGSALAFAPAGVDGLWLLYVLPGHALPPAHALLDGEGTYHSKPLGGAWYMVLQGRR